VINNRDITLGLGVGVLDFGSDCRREGAFLGVNLGHPIGRIDFLYT